MGQQNLHECHGARVKCTSAKCIGHMYPFFRLVCMIGDNMMAMYWLLNQFTIQRRFHFDYVLKLKECFNSYFSHTRA